MSGHAARRRRLRVRRVEDTGRWSWVDLRLVPAAAAVWLVTLLGPRVPAVGLLALAGAGLVTAAAVTWRGRRRAAATVALAALAGLTVAATVGAVRDTARGASPLAAAARAGDTLTVDLALDGDPTVLSGVRGSRVVATATVTAVEGAGSRTRTHDAVRLFGSAADWARVLPGEPVRVRVTPSLPRPGDPATAVLAARGPPTALGRPALLHRAAAAVRDRLGASAARTLEQPAAGLLPGLVVGDTRGQDPVFAEDARRAGLSHLTAVSGANVAILLAGVLGP